MNTLIVGTRKDAILHYLPPGPFLMIDDGPLLDTVERRARTFDVERHSINPLKDMDYRRARDFIGVLDAVFPEGENTLTRKTSNFVLLNELLTGTAKRLDKLIPTEPDKKDTGRLDAYQKLQTLLLSPVLERVLNRPSNFSMTGTILARVDRAVLGDFDAFVIGNILMSQYQGPIVVPDFGFYATKSHASLLRQDRLVAGVDILDDVPKLKRQLLLIDRKIPSHATADDAEVLALYDGKIRGTNAFTEFVQDGIR